MLVPHSHQAGVSYGQFDFDWLLASLTSHIKNRKCYLSLEHRALYAFEDFLISRDFTRPWGDLYRNVVEQEVGVLDRHSSKLQASIMARFDRLEPALQDRIMARFDQLERTLQDNVESQARDVRDLGVSLRLTTQLRLLTRALRSRLRRLIGAAH